MKRSLFVLVIFLIAAAASASDVPKRPHIFGIAYVRIFATNVGKARDFYSLALHSVPPPNDPKSPCDWCERAPVSLDLTKKQLGPVELDAIHAQTSSNLLSEVAFSTDDVKSLRDFLLKSSIAAEKLSKCGEDPCFGTFDPEHHRLIFVQKTNNPPVELMAASSSAPARSPIIHAGFVVHDRSAEDRFYQDILGFRMYWHGGMKDDQTDWVDMQVPDGTAWIEYMLHVPANADHHTLGVMNHIALGVPDVHAAQKQLLERGVKLTEEPKIGRDGKWQLNVYDPDDTRVEFMEFKPVEEPCCSEFIGPHPGPHP
jgi:catechol 2,3-dioxygenase-like lactoylglutathione lyase family enzyme